MRGPPDAPSSIFHPYPTTPPLPNGNIMKTIRILLIALLAAGSLTACSDVPTEPYGDCITMGGSSC